ncbi:MAG: recombinase family protein [Alphaproteobacteria bacterium]|nr:recombinase family protein [Alphaproteobacteria bacterium]
MMEFETQHHNFTNAVIYTRVSSKKQVKSGDGLRSQETRCLSYAGYKGYAVVKTFSDDLSGSSAQRPGLNDMLKFLKKNRKDGYVILIDDISRIARNIRTHLDLRDIINEIGAVLESPSIEFKNDPDSLFFENMQAVNADFFRRKNAQQTRNRRIARLSNGYWCFQKPAGYKHETVKGHGKLLVRDDPLASIIQEGLEGFASGRFQTQAELTRFFQEFPEFPKDRYGNVRDQRVNEIINRVIYAGYIEVPKYNIPLQKAKHEALISFETFQKNQERLKENAKVPARKNLKVDFPLRGAVVCKCGTPFTACWSKGKNKKYPYYLCHNRDCDLHRKSVPRDQMQSEFEELLKELRPSASMFNTMRAMFKDIWEYRLNNTKLLAKSAEKELVNIERKTEQLLDRLVETNSMAAISAYEGKIEKLEKEKIVLREKIENCGKPCHAFEEMFEHALTFLSNPYKLWVSDNLTLRRLVLKLAFSDRLTYIKNQGFRTPDLAFPFKALEGLKYGKNSMARPRGFEPLTS